jgi:hypothetical protein
MRSLKMGSPCLVLFVASVALCSPQRQGRGLGEMMESLWGGFSDQLDDFQVILLIYLLAES